MKSEDEAIPTPHDRRMPLAILALGAAVGLSWLGWYYSKGLTLAHYDAKAHLVVARRMVDAISPGYLQMGTHWLPLTHLLYLPFVIFDGQYRTGFIPSLLSVLAFALSGLLTFRIARRATASSGAGFFAAAILLANPNLGYLQSCPLTEPLYIALLLLAVDGFVNWRDSVDSSLPWLPAAWVALGGLCRYEGWYVFVGILGVIACDSFTGRIEMRRGVKAGVIYASLFSIPIALHFGYLFSRVHDSFLMRVVQGNPAPYETYKRPLLSVGYHFAELAQIAGAIPLLAGMAGLVFFMSRRDKWINWTPLLLLWLPSLVNISALYWGMIYRVRYSVILLPAIAIFAALPASTERDMRRPLIFCCFAAAALPWLSWLFPHEWTYHALFPGPGIFILPAFAVLLFLAGIATETHRWPLLCLCVVAMHLPALAGEDRPILSETLEHRAFEPERQQILTYLKQNYSGGRILIDSLKLAPLLYDSGLPLKDFVFNEGDRAMWRAAIRQPKGEVAWVCTLKGDEISGLLRVDPHLLDGYALVSQTENLSLFHLINQNR